MAEKEQGPPPYDVGFGRPPRSGQFKPGKSGNPRGRPPGRQSFRAILSKNLYQITKVRVGEEFRNVPVIEAVALRLMQQLLHGPANRTIELVKFMLPMVEQENEGFTVEVLKCLTDDELDALEDISRKLEAERERQRPV